MQRHLLGAPCIRTRFEKILPGQRVDVAVKRLTKGRMRVNIYIANVEYKFDGGIA
jgi:hypothetical protein